MQEGKPYIPPIIPKEDLDRFHKGGMGVRCGFGRTPAVVVVDMTRAFVDDRFPLARSSTGRPCAEAISELLRIARRERVPVFYTRWGSHWSTDTERGRWLDKGTALREPAEAHEIIPELAPAEGEVVIEKAKPSAFFGTQLASMLIDRGVDTVIVTGMVTSGCVRATVVDAFSYNFKVVVPLECVADRGTISHQVSLFDMDQKYADVLPLTEVIEAMKGVATGHGQISLTESAESWAG